MGCVGGEQADRQREIANTALRNLNISCLAGGDKENDDIEFPVKAQLHVCESYEPSLTNRVIGTCWLLYY